MLTAERKTATAASMGFRTAHSAALTAVEPPAAPLVCGTTTSPMARAARPTDGFPHPHPHPHPHLHPHPRQVASTLTSSLARTRLHCQSTWG